jgi:general stress protein 26
MTRTLSEISKAMRDIDFCTLATHSGDGSIGGRPMSNNRKVDYTGESRFFTYADRLMVRDIERDPNVGLSYMGDPGVFGVIGKPGLFIHVEGRASLIRDESRFAEHWEKSLDRWFPEGPRPPRALLGRRRGRRSHAGGRRRLTLSAGR